VCLRAISDVHKLPLGKLHPPLVGVTALVVHHIEKAVNQGFAQLAEVVAELFCFRAVLRGLEETREGEFLVSGNRESLRHRHCGDVLLALLLLLVFCQHTKHFSNEARQICDLKVGRALWVECAIQNVGTEIFNGLIDNVFLIRLGRRCRALDLCLQRQNHSAAGTCALGIVQ